MGAYRDQEKLDGEILPIIVNVLNFVKPPPGEACLLSFDDARTLFHEFGHALARAFVRRDLSVAGRHQCRVGFRRISRRSFTSIGSSRAKSCAASRAIIRRASRCPKP